MLGQCSPRPRAHLQSAGGRSLRMALSSVLERLWLWEGQIRVRPIKASSAPGMLPRFPATWRDCAGEPTVITSQPAPRRQLSCLVAFAYI